MKVLVIISPQCERAIAVAVSLGEPVALAERAGARHGSLRSIARAVWRW